MSGKKAKSQRESDKSFLQSSGSHTLDEKLSVECLEEMVHRGLLPSVELQDSSQVGVRFRNTMTCYVLV